jgi:hypothetical protein
MFMAALFVITRLQSRHPSANEWIKEMWEMYTMEFMELKMNDVMSFSGKWMELQIVMLS